MSKIDIWMWKMKSPNKRESNILKLVLSTTLECFSSSNSLEGHLLLCSRFHKFPIVTNILLFYYFLVLKGSKLSNLKSIKCKILYINCWCDFYKII